MTKTDRDGKTPMAGRDKPALNVWIGAGIGAGIGSAAIAAALLYASRAKKTPPG